MLRLVKGVVGVGVLRWVVLVVRIKGRQARGGGRCRRWERRHARVSVRHRLNARRTFRRLVDFASQLFVESRILLAVKDVLTILPAIVALQVDQNRGNVYVGNSVSLNAVLCLVGKQLKNYSVTSNLSVML